MAKKILITSALPYANGPLHFGHIAGSYLPGDCYARFQRLKKRDVLYVCGSDEYGIAIMLSAELAGRTPQEHVDIFHKVNQELFRKMNFSFDHYSRTTWKGHKKPVQQVFLDLLANGYIEKRETLQLYSEVEKRFLADRYVEGTCPQCGYAFARGDECQSCGASYEATDLKNPRSKLSKAPLELKPTTHWFLLLDKFKEQLTAWIAGKQWKSNVLNFAKNYIQELRPRAITRDSQWGVPLPLPDTEGKVLYVWFDAPVGYISASMEWAELRGDPELWKKYWLDSDTKLVNFMGKDNIPFHAITFPAMLMGQNTPYKLVDEIPANEFYKLEGRQFSKSDGWYIDLERFFQRYAVDQIRYAIAASAPEFADAEFSWREFQMRCNTDLLGKYGNLVNRVLVFARMHCQQKVPLSGSLEEEDRQFLSRCGELMDQAAANYEGFRLRAASQTMMELAQLGNIYFDRKRPWQDVKSEETRTRMETTIACCLRCLKNLAMISFPMIPETAEKVWQFLGYEISLPLKGWDLAMEEEIPVGQKLRDPEILFKRVEDVEIEKEIEQLHKMAEVLPKVESPLPPLKPLVGIEDVQKLDLRVGLILEAQAVPKSKKLLQLKVDIGLETRTIVSGISQYYTPEALVGKRVVIVANLKPATLMGVESKGMVLAGSLDAALELPVVQQLLPGSCVT